MKKVGVRTVTILLAIAGAAALWVFVEMVIPGALDGSSACYSAEDSFTICE